MGKNNTTQRQPNGQFAKGNKEGNRFSETNKADPKKISEAIQKKNAAKRETEKTVDILTRILQKLVKDKSGQELTAKEAMLLSLLQKGLKGDIRAIELIIKLLGEMPAEKQEILNLTPQVVVADAETKNKIDTLFKDANNG